MTKSEAHHYSDIETIHGLFRYILFFYSNSKDSGRLVSIFNIFINFMNLYCMANAACMYCTIYIYTVFSVVMFKRKHVHVLYVRVFPYYS